MKPRFWLGFSTGLLVGIVVAIVFYFVDKSLNDPIKLLVTTPTASAPAQVVSADTNIGKTVVPKPSRSSHSAKSLSPADSVNSDNEGMEDVLSVELMDEGAFSLPQATETDDIPTSDFVAQANVRVKAAAGVNAPITTLEVEQWHEPVNNKYSYQRSGKHLKIKGMEISSVSISFEDGQYYLEYKGKKYAIPENAEWQRLTAVKNA